MGSCGGIGDLRLARIERGAGMTCLLVNVRRLRLWEMFPLLSHILTESSIVRLSMDALVGVG